MSTQDSNLHDLSGYGTDGQTQTTFAANSDRGERDRTGPAGEKCACHPAWLDEYEAGEDPLMCFSCFRELRRRRQEVDREADHYPESEPNRGEGR